MNTPHIVAGMRQSGFDLRLLPGERLVVFPVPPPDLVQRLREAKPELLRWLKLEQAATQACQGLEGYVTPGNLLSRLEPADLAELEACPDPLPFLASFAIACAWSDFRKEGVAPPAWNKVAECGRCGKVWLWCSARVAGCPWCWNRKQGLPIPTPPERRTQNNQHGGMLPF